MNEEQLKKIEKEILDSFEKIDKLEKNINFLAENISTRLVFENVKFEFLDEVYMISLIKNTFGKKPDLTLHAVTLEKKYTVNLEDLDPELSFAQNVECSLKSLLSHIAGILKPDEIE